MPQSNWMNWQELKRVEARASGNYMTFAVCLALLKSLVLGTSEFSACKILSFGFLIVSLCN